MGYVVPFDRRVLMDIFVPPGQEGGASPGEMVTRRADALADGDARRDRARRRGARRHRRARRRHRDHHPQVRHSRRALRRGGAPKRCGSASRSSERGHRAAAPTFAICVDRDDRRRARARLRRCDHDREAAERPLLAGRAHRRRLALRARRAARSIARRTSAARRSISRSAPCTCFRPSWRPACAA